MTIIYYTSNREDESFEEKIREELLKSSNGVPIISVSHKPIKLGKNICIGEVELSNINIKKQILIGAKEATTENVCMAESDFLYPEEYFKFVPPEKDAVYYLNNLFVLWRTRNRFHRKSNSDGALVCNRLHLIHLLSNLFEGKVPPNKALYIGKRKPFRTSIPAVTFKTGNGMSWGCPHTKKTYRAKLPQWGSAKQLNRRFNEFI